MKDEFETAGEGLLGAIRSVRKLQCHAPPLIPTPRDGELPLSFAQQRLWNLHQIDSRNPVYHSARAYRIAGDLDVAAMSRSLGEMARRHELLRSAFPTVDGRPVTKIAPPPPDVLSFVNLRNVPSEDKETEVSRILAEEVRRPFLLSQGFLFRFILIELAKAEHILLLITHHILYAGQAWGFFARELSALYEAFSAGKASPLAEPPIQYVDFARWQRQWLQGETLNTLLAYWKKQTGGGFERLKLPVDYPPRSIQGCAAESLSLEVPGDLTEKLKNLSRQESVTLYVTLLAALQTLLFHYSRQNTIPVFTPVVNRTRSEFGKMPGIFTNILPMITDFSGARSFREILRRTHDAVLGAYAHQDLPVERIISGLPSGPGGERSLFQVLFLFENTPQQPPRLTGLTVTPIDADRKATAFDVSLFLTERERRLVGKVYYKIDLFDSNTIRRLSGDFLTVLEKVSASPLEPLLDIPVRARQEKSGAGGDSDSALPGGDRMEAAVPPRDELELQLVHCWEEAFGFHPIGVKSNFFEIGGHSLIAVRLFSQIQKAFDVNIPLDSLFRSPTIEQFAAILRQEGCLPSWSSLVPIQPKGSRRPFFCVHPVGGNILCYYDIANLIGHEQPFYGFRSLGLKEGAHPHARIEDMASCYIEEMRTVQPQGPYLLGGMCLGGMVAYEMARQLNAGGQEVAAVIMIDTRKPTPFLSATERKLFLSQGPVRFAMHRLHSRLRIGEFLGASIKERWQGIKGRKSIPLEHRIKLVRLANKRARDKYLPRAYSGRVVFLWASESSELIRTLHDPRLGWSSLVTGSVEVHTFSGSHETILKEPHVRSLAEKVRECLAAAQKTM